MTISLEFNRIYVNEYQLANVYQRVYSNITYSSHLVQFHPLGEDCEEYGAPWSATGAKKRSTDSVGEFSLLVNFL